jgi:cadmium resistance transport/sequestration family protein
LGGRFLINTLISAFVSFVSTNIDDILVLMLFFSQVNTAVKKRHIIIGQYLAIGALTIISIIGALGISIVPQEYVRLFGLIPIALGIKACFGHKKENTDKESYINLTITKVFCVTFANGGDNIGIYIPLFTTMNLVDLLATILIFALLIGLWCFIGIKLGEHPFIQRNIKKYKHIFIPIVFIGLGLFILDI